MRRFGLRMRFTAGFAAGALLISTVMALASFDLTRRSLVNGRERSAVRAAYFDATVVHAGLASDEPDIVDVLRSLDTGGSRRVVLSRHSQWYGRGPDTGFTTAIPAALYDLVLGGQPGVQRVRVDAGTALVIGVPLPDNTALFVIDSLHELDDTLRTLSLVLMLVAMGTTVAGAGLGTYATRRVLQPLSSVVAASRDITAGNLDARLDPDAEPELERLANSFNRMVDELATRIHRDRRFAADVSHELRSPLQTLAAAASVLDRRRIHLDDRTNSAVRLVCDEVYRFQSLVTDLLELARSDEAVDPVAVDVVDLTVHVCTARGLPGHIVDASECRDNSWDVDQRRFEQILVNLLDNAERHGGGVVAVRLSGGDGVGVVEIDDEGPGVHLDERHVIFDRFVRGRLAQARSDDFGTGLGLALVAQHVKAHGGEVRVTDRPGGGARFRATFPTGAAR